VYADLGVLHPAFNYLLDAIVHSQGDKNPLMLNLKAIIFFLFDSAKVTSTFAQYVQINGYE